MNYGGSKHSKPHNLVQNKKKQNRRPEPRKHTKDPPLAILVFFIWIFLALRFFSKIIGLLQRAPLHWLRYFTTEWMLKNPKGFTFLGTATLFKSSFFIFIEFFFQVSKGSPFNFFHILQQTGVSKSPKGPLLQF